MVKYIAREKGTGKSKQLIEIANESAKNTSGSLVYIDDNKIPSLTLHQSVRFVVTSEYRISGLMEFLGFVCGILSQNSDIVEIFIDGLTNIAGSFDDDALVLFSNKLQTLSKEHSVDLLITINKSADTFPAKLSEMIYK